jgi:phosphoribosylformylglycinamidine synthase
MTAGPPHRARGAKKVLYLGFVNPAAEIFLRVPHREAPEPVSGATVISGTRYSRRRVSATVAGSTVRVEVRVELKPGIVDAEAESIQKSLALLGLRSIRGVTTARIYSLEFSGTNAEDAEETARQAVDRLLANPVIHRVAIRRVPD